MRSIATITTGPSVTRLTTLSRIKQELGIASSDDDALLAAKIDEATSDIEAHLSRTFARATLSETFWPTEGAITSDTLIMARAPIASVTSIAEDDVAVASTEYRIDASAGLIHRLDASGYPSFWLAHKAIVVVYAAGFLLPGESGRDLPAAVEAGAIELVQSFWQARGRDPLVKAEEVPGVMRTDYWVGAVGEAGQLPPGVWAKIAPFRRVRL